MISCSRHPFPVVLVALLVLAACDDDPQYGSPTEPPIIDPDLLPPPSAVVAIDDPYRPARVTLAWGPPAPADPAYVVAGYEVAVAANGPLTAANWDAAARLAAVAGAGGGAVTVDALAPGIVPGAVLDFGVRALYAAAGDTVPLPGAASVPAGVRHAVTDTAWVTGTVTDDAGRPVAGTDVVALPVLLRATTGADGAYRLGPLSDRAAVVLQTESPDAVSAPGAGDAWFDVRTDTVRAGAVVPLTLLTRWDLQTYGLDAFAAWFVAANAGWYPGVEFRNWRWPDDAYPLPVHAPVDSITHEGYTSYPHEIAREAVARWNEALARPGGALRLVADPDSAVIRFAYDWSPTTNGARAIPEPPTGFRTAPPEGVRILVTNKPGYWWEGNGPLVLGVFLHELGHALGTFHAPDVLQDGAEVDIVMNLDAFRPDRPTVWDVRLVEAKARVPQGFPLDHYECWNADPPAGDFAPLAAPADRPYHR